MVGKTPGLAAIVTTIEHPTEGIWQLIFHCSLFTETVKGTTPDTFLIIPFHQEEEEEEIFPELEVHVRSCSNKIDS